MSAVAALLVSRFRRSYYLAAPAFTNVGNKGTLASHDPSVAQPLFFAAGTGRPDIFTLTEPRWVRLVKYKVFQSSPPKALLVVAGWPCTMRPRFLPCASRLQIPPAPPQ